MVRLLSPIRPVHCTLSSFHRISKICQRNLHISSILGKSKSGCEFEAFKSDHCSGTVQDVRDMIRERIGVEPGYHVIPKCRSNLLKFQPKHQDLPKRSMKDSFTTVFLPLSNTAFREHYVNHLGRVRMGRIMEELDLFAVWICHRHVHIPTLPKGIPLPYVFVTLLVDEVDFLNVNNITSEEDIHLLGHVSWTGTSSLEVTVYIQQNFRTVLKSLIVMVARNATNTGPAAVNPLKPDGEEEQKCLEEAINRQKQRIKNHTKSVLNIRPTSKDEKLMYELFQRLEGSNCTTFGKPILPQNARWMSNSFQTNMLHPFPDNRNSHNTVFGGYIMRNALEISFITACVYSGSRPVIECILDVAFYKPVKVHSFIKMTSYVVYTFQKYMQLMTIVEVLDANGLEQVTTNAFHLTFRSEHDIQEVLPATYQESLWHINGRNKFQAFQDIRKKLSEDLNDENYTNM